MAKKSNGRPKPGESSPSRKVRGWKAQAGNGQKVVAQKAPAADTLTNQIPEGLLQAKEQFENEMGGVAAIIAARTSVRTTHKLGKENLGGWAIGEKMINKRSTGQLAIKVYVQRKANIGLIHEEALIPPTVKVGGTEYLTDVVELGIIRARSPITTLPVDPEAIEAAALGVTFRQRPAKGGCSVGHFRITAGTFGALVVVPASDGQSELLAILSNNHVLANVNGGARGDPILQPGPADGGKNPDDQLAELLQFITLDFQAADNDVDCAIAWADPAQVDFRHQSFTIDAESGPLPAQVGMPVKKDGRTTGFTKGIIRDMHASIPVEYERVDGGQLKKFHATFRNQIKIQGQDGHFSDRGDSGSLIVSDAGTRPVALLFAGGSSPTGVDFTFANPIQKVMDMLKIDRFCSEQDLADARQS
jgi:hypothetical protein